jgi:hypothetical protein
MDTTKELRNALQMEIEGKAENERVSSDCDTKLLRNALRQKQKWTVIK